MFEDDVTRPACSRVEFMNHHIDPPPPTPPPLSPQARYSPFLESKLLDWGVRVWREGVPCVLVWGDIGLDVCGN